MARSLTRSRTAPVDPEDVSGEEGQAEPTEERWEDAKPEPQTFARRPRRGGSGDSEDRPRSSRRVASSGGSVGGGWDAAKRAKGKQKSGVSEDEFKVTDADEEYLIHFLEDRPVVSYAEHWIDEITEKGVKRSYVCLETLDDPEDCPLCGSGHDPRFYAIFNVLSFAGGNSKPKNKWWKTTTNPFEAIEKRANTARTSPINKEKQYFAVSKTKANATFAYSVDPVAADELKEDFGIDPLTGAELDRYCANAFSAKQVVKANTASELQEIVDKYLED